jgi:hypothetical protein
MDDADRDRIAPGAAKNMRADALESGTPRSRALPTDATWIAEKV